MKKHRNTENFFFFVALDLQGRGVDSVEDKDAVQRHPLMRHKLDNLQAHDASIKRGNIVQLGTPVAHLVKCTTLVI